MSLNYRFLLLLLLTTKSFDHFALAASDGSGLFAQRSGFKYLEGILQTVQVSNQNQCSVRCLHVSDCRACNVGPAQSTAAADSDQRSCELVNVSGVMATTTQQHQGWTILVGKFSICMIQ